MALAIVSSLTGGQRLEDGIPAAFRGKAIELAGWGEAKIAFQRSITTVKGVGINASLAQHGLIGPTGVGIRTGKHHRDLPVLRAIEHLIEQGKLMPVVEGDIAV